MPKPDEPVGVNEIAQHVDVTKDAVHQWRRRHRQSAPPFPRPRWTVSGWPAWRWGDIENWLRKTGRGHLIKDDPG